MFTLYLILVPQLAAGDSISEGGAEPPAQRELFAREDWYRGQEGKEESFEGVLKRQDRGKSAAGFGRFNPYRLVMKSDTREVYVGMHGRLLEPYLRKTVRLTGKAVNREVEGVQHREIWPARLQVVQGGPAEGKADATKLPVHAQGAWPWVPLHKPAALSRQIQQLVFRSRADLERVAGTNSLALVAAGLQVEGIDFKKEMLLAIADGTQPMVGVSGGDPPSAPYRVRINQIERDEKTGQVTVHWQRIARGARDVLSYPLEMVVVRRFDGEVRFERGPDPGAPAAAPKTGGGKEVKVLARGFWPDGQITAAPPHQWVVRRYEDLVDPRIKANEEVIEKMRQAEVKKYTQALGVPTVDFTRHMLVGVSAGVQRTGGYRLVILWGDRSGKEGAITVHWKLQPPAKDKPVPAGPSHPAAVALIDQAGGPVRFDPRAPDEKEDRQATAPGRGRSDRD